MMPEQIENPMVVNWWWGEIEYGIPDKSRLRREKKNYDEAEMEEEEE